MKKLIEKSQKLTKKSKRCANYELETHFKSLRNTVVSNFEVYNSIKHSIKFISTKNQITSKRTGPLRRKTAKNGYLYVLSVKNTFQSHSLNAAHDQKTSLAQKKIVHTAILLTFAFRSKQRLNE